MSNANALTGAAFDVQSLDALKREVKNSPQSGLKEAARQMEGLFVQMMLKSMRDATPKEGLFDSDQSRMFTAMYDQQISQDIASRGLGLADMMVKQLGGEASEAKTVVATHMTPLSFGSDIRDSMAQATLQKNIRRAFPSLGNDDLPKQSTGPVLNNANFISRLSTPAQIAARESGIPHQLIMAQAALESGWGEQEIPGSDGKPSHNLFGIKAGRDWKGKTTEITTTEYISGVAQKVKAKFKVYDSYTEAMSDYASLLSRNPRYKNVVRAKTPEMAAHALQSAGYATDPHYAKKLVNIIQHVKGEVKQAMKAYQTDLSAIF